MSRGIVFDVREMTVHDGDGVRVTVFLKGCPLRCEWCHNPEGLKMQPQLLYKRAKCVRCGLCRQGCAHEECQPFGRCLHVCPNDCLCVCGRAYEAAELAEKLRGYEKIFAACGGGVTFSGGEPLLQTAFLSEVADGLKGIHTAVETCGYADGDTFRRIVDKLDFVIMDFKIFDREAHKRYTGVYNDVIKENFLYLKGSGKPYLIRTPLIAGKTDSEENLAAIARFIGDSPWEKLPENRLAGAKYALLEGEGGGKVN